MTTAPAPNHRASLLDGLRTGGVRSTSSPRGNVPHTAAPGGTFNVPRYPTHQYSVYEDDDDQLADIPSENVFLNPHSLNRAVPMTAAVDGPNNRFVQQQQAQGQRGMNPNSAPFNPAFAAGNMLAATPQVQTQALQLQMMQLEIMRLQTQHYQEMMMNQVRQQQQQQQQQQLSQTPNRRVSVGFNPPATAGPLSTGFDLRSATLSAQARRASQADHLMPQVGADDQVPMTAALGGKFGSRTAGLSSNSAISRFVTEDHDDSNPPPTPSTTTVISGGTSLGNPASNNMSSSTLNATPSKSDSTSWRRGGNNNSVLSGNNRVTISPSVRVTPPPTERISPPPGLSATKSRPVPLRFNAAASQPLPAVAIDENSADADGNDNDDTYSSSSSKSGGTNSSPTTPRSSSSNESPLSPREEAAKKLYEGLGIGRPAPTTVIVGAQQPSFIVSHRMASQPMRQPRGPPSGADELGPKNFATRIRRQAIGGLGMLMGARERREIVEAY